MDIKEMERREKREAMGFDPYAEIAKLRAALKPFADIAGQYDDLRSGNPDAPDSTIITVPLGACRAALRAGA